MPISSTDLKPYVRRVFVETGSAGLGLGIRAALTAGFQEVYSVDINPAAYEECSKIFADDKRVHLYCEDCGIWLERILNEIGEDCTIYLDANGWKDEIEHPLFTSFRAINRHGGKNHILLIDDMNADRASRETCERRTLFLKNDVVEGIRDIRDNYHLKLIDTHSTDDSEVYGCWVLVAEPQRKEVGYRFAFSAWKAEPPQGGVSSSLTPSA